MIRKKYLKEYEIDPSVGKFSDKRAVYIGKKYRFESSPEKVKRAKIISLILSGVAFACLVAAECITTRASYAYYTVIPYVVSVILYGWLFKCCIASTVYSDWVTHKEYDANLKPQVPLAALGGAFCLISVVAQLFLKIECAADICRLSLISLSCLLCVPCVLESKRLKCAPEQ